MPKTQQKVFVAMSGGLDSSVTAALLKEQGYQIKGIFFRFWKERRGSENRYCSLEGEKRARRVCQKLKIPFYIWDFQKEFKKKIIDYFIKTYAKGLTPNPCVQCNKFIKFGLFMEKAKKMGADFIATGHYVKKSKVKSPTLRVVTRRVKKSKVIYRLFRAKDKNKDQSYFLYQLKQNQLKHILFPIGDYTKEEVKKLAKKYRLPISHLRESQEICFVFSGLKNFLKKKIKTKPGKIIDINTNEILGRHQGVQFYTVGQRRGIKLAGGPWYVVDHKVNKLLVTNKKNDSRLYKKELIAKNVNWILGVEPKLPLKVKAKIRYRHKPVLAKITKSKESNTYNLIFNKPQRAVTPGQSVVFYSGDEVLGGGIIKL